MGRTIAGSEPWWPPRRTAPAGAPNVVLILLDDMGFSDVGTFGSEIPTPNIDRLAENGIRHTNFQATPLCSPTRASILSGLNHHRAGYAAVAATDPGFPNRRFELPENVATLPEILRDNGYATLAVGKWHLAKESETHDAGSRSMWPCSVGFDRFYGFLGGFTTQHHPHQLIVDSSSLEIDRYPDGYYLTDDLTDRAIRMIQSVRANDPTKPFFLYFAHAAMHGPLQAKAEDIARHGGRYDVGWDRVREERFARQLELGLFPPGTRLPPPNTEPGQEARSWSDYSDADRKLFARMMEVYAAMVENVDQNTGRLLAAIDALGELDNTIVLFMSDNGATGEGGERGMLRYLKDFIPRPGRQRDIDRECDLELLGGPRVHFHYPRGWGMTCNTPFRLYKNTVHEGGVHVPLVVSWPAGLPEAARGALRADYQYVTDLLPTVLELAGVPLPTERDGRPLQRIDGTSFAASLRNAEASGSRTDQYHEMSGHRAYYRDGWKAVTLHAPRTSFAEDRWELYHLARDPTESEDLATPEAALVRELAEAWEAAADANGVYPLDEGSGLSVAQPEPGAERFAEEVMLLPGIPTLERARSGKLIAFRSFAAEISFAWAAGNKGVLLAHGGQGGGYVVYIEGGRLRAAYNDYDDLRELEGPTLTAGRHTATLEVRAYEGGACDVALLLNSVETARVDGVLALVGFCPFEGIDVGIDRRSPVSWPLYERHGPFPYTGTLHSVTYRPGELVPDAPVLKLEVLRSAGLRFQ